MAINKCASQNVGTSDNRSWPVDRRFSLTSPNLGTNADTSADPDPSLADDAAGANGTTPTLVNRTAQPTALRVVDRRSGRATALTLDPGWAASNR